MRVLHVLPSISLQQGGPTQACFNFVRSLRQAGIDAEIATTNDDGKNLLDVPLNHRFDYFDVPVYFFPRIGRMKSFIPSPSLSGWLWQHIEYYDLIHTHYLFSYVPTSAMAIARRKEIPYIARTIGQLTPWALSQSHLRKRVYTSLMERENLNQAAAIHCTSLSEARDVENFRIKAQKFVLPLGVNSSPIDSSDSRKVLCEKYNIPPKCKITLFLSRLHKKKRPDFLLEVLGKLNKSCLNCHLLIAGSGDGKFDESLKDLSRKLGVDDCVTFTGFVSGADKDLLLRGADIFALPSFSENFGVAVAEALAAGLPVIVTPGVQISPDIQEANAGLVVPAKLEDWANAFRTVFESPEMMRTLSYNGQQLAKEKYSWPTIVRQLIQVYQDILAEQPIRHLGS
jgi:glycosyltransferase involved in cell wall biosynthesis